MNRHEWVQQAESASIIMRCIRCGERIDTENTEHWNLEIFANCPEN